MFVCLFILLFVRLFVCLFVFSFFSLVIITTLLTLFHFLFFLLWPCFLSPLCLIYPPYFLSFLLFYIAYCPTPFFSSSSSSSSLSSHLLFSSFLILSLLFLFFISFFFKLPSIFKSGNDSDDERIRTIETADYPQNNKDQLVVDSNEFNISPLSLEGHPTSPISPSTVCLSPQLISPSSLLPSSSSSSLSSSSSSSQPISLTLGAPRVSNKRRGREGGRDSDTDNSRSNIPKNLNRNHLRGSDAAKLFLEEHSILLHRYVNLIDCNSNFEHFCTLLSKCLNFFIS